jgi:hypothetical protein
MAEEEIKLVRLIGGPYDGHEAQRVDGQTECRILVDLQLFEAVQDVVKLAKDGASPARNQGEFYLWLQEQVGRAHRDRVGDSKLRTALYRESSDPELFEFAGYLNDGSADKFGT